MSQRTGSAEGKRSGDRRSAGAEYGAPIVERCLAALGCGGSPRPIVSPSARRPWGVHVQLLGQRPGTELKPHATTEPLVLNPTDRSANVEPVEAPFGPAERDVGPEVGWERGRRA